MEKMIAKIELNSTVFQIGDFVRVSFDFTNAELPCFEIAIILQRREEINESIVDPLRKNLNIVENVCQCHIFTYNLLSTEHSFQIPPSLTQQFSTEYGLFSF